MWTSENPPSIALCSDIGPLLLPSSDGGCAGHPGAYGPMLKRSHRRGGPMSLTTALGTSVNKGKKEAGAQPLRPP
jgi:hypothetical protein